MRFRTLAEWLAWQERLHPTAMDLGLERCRAVAERMGLLSPASRIVSVAGTNGKGACVSFMEAMLLAAGYRVGAYLSPHVVRYNERIRLDGQEVSDARLMRAFQAVDEHRREVSLTYFEFGTLAAAEIFRGAAPDIVLLEVGLGGRLDAVNVFDADTAVIMPIAIDHTQWLGDTREAIAREKAGIIRPGRPAICADPDPPRSLIEAAASSEAPLHRWERDFRALREHGSWRWEHAGQAVDDLPYPALVGAFQVQNAAAAIAAVRALVPTLSSDAIRRGVADARLAGRFQIVASAPEIILDVAHNPHAARSLAATLATRPCAGTTHAVFAMLRDKDIAGVFEAMAGVVEVWHVAGLGVARGASRAELLDRVRGVAENVELRAYDDVARAFGGARAQLRAADRLIVFGSFHTVGEVMLLEV